MLEPVRLQNEHVQLSALGEEHLVGLDAALDDGVLAQLFYTSTSIAGGASALVAQALAARAAGHRQAYVVRGADNGEVLGSTSFYDPEPSVPRIAIGYTWYTARARRTAVNTSCKLLLLTHAFEVLGCETVQFHTDRFNLTSQRAIARLGATREGVLRHHQRRHDGGLRDTVCFSILAGEWDDVRRLLELRLQQGDQAR